MEPLTQYRWPVDQIPLAGLSVRVDDLAARSGCSVSTWIEAGLGEAHGFGCRSSSGYVFLVQELQEAARFQSDVYVDATLMAALGAKTILEEMLKEFGLDHGKICWQASSETEAFAVRQVAKFAEWVASKHGRPT